MNVYSEPRGQLEIDVLHEIGERISAADPLHHILNLVVNFVSTVLQCDSCFIYILEGSELTLRASRNPHEGVLNRLKLRLGQGITGWVAENKKPVAIAGHASLDPRFQSFLQLPEDTFEAFLSVPVMCRERLVGVINIQHREPYHHTRREIQLISTIGFLVGPEIVSAKLDAERSSELSEACELVERAKGILAQNLRIDEIEASLVLQRLSRQRRKSIKELAEAILIVDEIHHTQKPSPS